MRIMVRSKRRKIRWLKKGESDRLRILTQNFSQEDTEVEFVTPVTPGGSVKFLPAV